MESSSESLQLNNTVASSCTTFDIDGKVEVNNNKSMVSAVPTFIHYASDPAKVVLDALRLKGYCHLNWQTNKNSKVATTKKRTKKNENIMKSFIFLFEQLREFSVEIKPSVKEEAMEFAVEWDEKRTDLHTPEVFGYLQFLATYKLASLVDEDELLRLLLSVHGCKEAAVLSRVLGVAHKIPHLIQGLIQKKHFLEAAQYVLRFELVDEFPPVPLLISHLSHSQKLAKEKCQQEQNSQSALNESEEEEVAALRSVIKCINDYGLHSHYSPDILEHRIEELNRRRAIKQQNWRMAKRIEQRNKRRGKRIMNKFNGQKANNRVAMPSSPSPAPPVPVPTPTLTPATTPVLGPQSRQQGPKKRPAPAPVRGPTPACCTSRSSTKPDSQQMQKRARLVAPAEAAPSAPQPTGYPSQHRAGQLTEQSEPYLRATEAHYSLGGSVPPLLHPPMSHIGWQHRPDPVAGGGTPMPFSFTNHFGAVGHLNPRPPTSAGPPYLNGSRH